MNEHAPVDLEEEHMQLLADYRAQREVPGDAAARVWRRLEQDGEAEATAPAPPAPASAVRGRWWLGLVAAALIFAAIGIGLWAPRMAAREEPRPSAAEYDRESPDPREAVPVRPRAVVPDPPPPEAPPRVDEASSDAVEPEQGEQTQPGAPATDPDRTGRSRGRSKPAVEDEPATADSLAEEAKLLARAQNAISGGHHGAALAALSQHARRFPRGSMVEERRALEIIALCSSGKLDKGRKRLARFLVRHPRSVLRQRARDACAEP